MGDEGEFDKNPIKGRLNLAGLVKVEEHLFQIAWFASNSR
jgi:hypothetical protein